MRRLQTLGFLFALCYITILTEGHAEFTCSWYGQCGTSKKGLPRICVSNIAPQLINNVTAEDMLRERCPHFFQNGSPKTCCNVDQIMTMSKNMKMVESFFGKCQTCAKNMFRQYCDQTCSPEHSRYLRVTKTGKDGEFEYVEEIEVHVTEQYLNATYNSCKDISFPAPGQSIMDLACGSHGASKCNAKLWYEFMGDYEKNIFAPFQMNFVYDAPEKWGDKPLDGSSKKCNEPYDDSSKACDCTDCPSACN